MQTNPKLPINPSRRLSARLVLAFLAIAISSHSLLARQSLDELEQDAFQAAADFAQGSVVQVEAFGGLEFVNRQAVAPGPSTGTVLTSDGWIATSMFLFRGQPASITVVLPNEERKAAKLVARDYSREIALLKIDTDTPLKAVTPSPVAGWQVGQWTLALGKTFDPKTTSRSVGILSAKGRIWNKAIQSDCKISPQNYGGPLIDLEGKVMGILTTINPGIMTEGEVEQWYDSGVGFAIPIHDILERLPRMQSGEDIHPGKIGIRILGRDEFLEGLELGGVSPGAPAAKAGLLAGDKIRGVGRTKESIAPVLTHTQFKHAMGPIDANQPVTIEVDRNGERVQFSFTTVKDLPEYREPFLGIVTYREKDFSERILEILPDGPAATSGLKKGDAILSLNGTVFSEKSGLSNRLQFVDYRDPVKLGVRGEHQEVRELSVQPTTRPDTDKIMPAVIYPKGDAADPATQPRGIVPLPLGDVKNKAFAIVPNSYRSDVPHGLLMIYGEAGPQDSKAWGSVWEKFAEEHRWIVVVMQSAEEKAWMFEEVEIGARLRSYMSTNYSIDSRRACVGGISSASILAIITSIQLSESFNAVWISDGKIPDRVRPPAAEPGKTVRYFVNGSEEDLKGFAANATKAGHNVHFHADRAGKTKGEDAARFQDTQLIEKLQRWLRLLEAI